MAEVSNFVYCLNSVATDQETSALGILTAITPEYMPGEFSFSILCSIVDIQEGNHKVSFCFEGPSDQQLAKVEGDVPFSKSKEVDLPNEYEGVNISVNIMNVVLKEVGLYTTIVYVDEQNCGSFPIFVKGINKSD